MSDGHLPDGLVVRFLEQEASREERRTVVRHLLAGCDECRRRVAAQAGLDLVLATPTLFERAVQDGDASYEEIFDRLLQFPGPDDLSEPRERLRGLGLLSALLGLPSAERLVALESDRRFVCPPLCERLLGHAEALTHENAAEAVAAAELAVVVAAALCDESGPDLRARAHAACGNARRLLREFDGAATAFSRARQIHEETAAAPKERAELLLLEAALERNLGRWEGALASLEAALLTFQRLREIRLQGDTLLQMARVVGPAEPERGVALLKEALACIRIEETPRLELAAQFHLAWFLRDAERPSEALVVLETARSLFAAFREPELAFRQHWLEARIGQSLGESFAAEQTFLSLAAAAQTRGRTRDLLHVTLDLAALYAERGARRPAATLTAALYPTLRAAKLHSEGLAFWWLLSREFETLDDPAGAVRTLGEYYRRHFFRPQQGSADA